MRQGIDYAWDGPSAGSIKAAGYTFACRYLSYDTTGKNLTKAEADALHSAGIDTVSNWEYEAEAALNGYSQGSTDATNAQQQHLACGGPPDRPIYFSVDFDATEAQQAAINSYMDGVASVIGRNRTGAYGDYYVVKRLFDAGKITWGWQTYAWSGGQWDDRAQLRQVQNGIRVDGADCDRNQAMTDDFGQWGVTDMPTDAQWNDFIQRFNNLYTGTLDSGGQNVAPRWWRRIVAGEFNSSYNNPGPGLQQISDKLDQLTQKLEQSITRLSDEDRQAIAEQVINQLRLERSGEKEQGGSTQAS